MKKIEFDNDKTNILLPSNVFWDKGLNEMNVIFKSVIDWILETIEFISNYQDKHLYIKIHPAEKYFSSNSKIGVAQIIKEKFISIPDNVSIIEAEQKISPYDIFEFIDLGIVYSGT